MAQRVADGELSRVMFFLPPRHSKSETISRLFSAYYLRRHPEKWVGINSYSAELAYTLSRSARDFYVRDGGQVRGDAGAVKHWETGQGGGLWAAGVGGPITGKGFHLGIIDDPLKNAEEAASEVIRRKHQDWFSSTFYTRAEPHAAIVLIQTRWHEEDLSGWLLSQESGENVERWYIVNLPAFAEEPQAFPVSCEVEPDTRQMGAALCEDRYNAAQLRKIQQRIGDYYFDALYQQRPTAKEGDFFKVSKIEIIPAAPASLRLCRGWDLAASTDSGAYTCGALLGVDPSGVWYVCDVQRGQWSSDDVVRQLRSITTSDGGGVRVHLPQDPGQAGKGQAAQLVRMLAGYQVKAEPVSGSKESRAFNLAAQINAGNVRLIKGEWNRAFI